MTELDDSAAFLREKIRAIDQAIEALGGRRAALVAALKALRCDVSLADTGSAPALGGHPVSTGSAPVVGDDRRSEDEDPRSLTDRVSQLLQTSGPMKRRQLVQAFRPAGIKPGTVDSAVYRLIRRRMVEKRGALFAIRAPEPQAVGNGAALASAPGDAGAVRGAPAATLGPSPAQPVPDTDDAGSLRARVFAAVVSGVKERRALVQLFAGEGVTSAQVDTALSGLRGAGRLKSVGRGVNVVVESAAQGSTEGSRGS